MRALYDEFQKTHAVAKPVKQLMDVLVDGLSQLEYTNPEMFSRIHDEMYIAVYGEHFNEATALKATEHMDNNDGSTGPHFTPEDTDKLAQRIGLDLTTSSFNKWDWYYTVNMVYSDYYGYVSNDLSMYANIAKAFICDKDAPEGKAYRYYDAMR